MPTRKGTLEEEVKNLDLTDFSGGLNSQKDLQDMDLNESPDCLNVYAQPGRLLGRKGVQEAEEPLPGPADGHLFMYDELGSRHKLVWSLGNLYETISGAMDLKATGCYVSGEKVAHTTYNGICYFSDGITPLRQYDPITEVEQAVPNSGTLGTVPPPAAKVLITYAGSIVAGCCVTSGTPEPDMFRWSNVNDPTTWLGVNVQAVGRGQGGEINAMDALAVGDSGVSPFRAIFVGKSQFGVYGYQGALGTLQEFLLAASCGVLDGSSVEFIPAPDGRAMVVWLGTDRKVWYSNGITADELSGAIRDELSAYVQSQIQTKPNPLFCGVRNDENSHYVLDCGDGRQYVYDYGNKYWTKYQGWPSGYWTEGTDATGFPAIFVASNIDDFIGQANIGLLDRDDTPIDHYWKTGYLGGGNNQRYKDWIWGYVTFKTAPGGHVTVTVQEGPIPDGAGTGMEAVFTVAINAEGGYFVLDQSLLDGPDVLAPDEAGTWQTYRVKSRLRCAVTNELRELIPYETMKAADVQVTLSQTASATHFEVLGLRLQFLWRGYAHVGQNT